MWAGGCTPSPRRPWGARPPGPRPRRLGALRTRRFSPSRPAVGSRPSIDCGSSRKRTAVASRARSAACCIARGCTARICRTWRKARRRGALQGLAPRKRGPKPAPSHPLGAQVRRLEAQVARLEKELATAPTILEVQGNVAGLLGFSLRDGKDCGWPPLPSLGRSALRRPVGRWGCSGPRSTAAGGPLPGISSPVRRPPGPGARGAGAGPRPARLPAFRRSFPGRGRGHEARRRTVPGLGAHEVPHPLCPAAGAGTAQPAHPPTLCQARTRRPRSEPGRVLGPHTAARAEDRVFLLPLRAA